METPGTILKREREQQGISLKEIASITRIPTSALRNIEEDRFDLFPAEVFAKGFLRNYARELSISTDDVMLAYNALRHQQRRQDLIEIPIRSQEMPRKRAPEAIRSLVLSSPKADHDNASVPPVDSSQKTFRFAYLVVFLVVATSLGPSILFTGTGEAVENGKHKMRPVVEGEAEKGSRWLMPDQTLTSVPAPTEAWSRPAFPADDEGK